jgi:hypothetical protein
MNPAVTVLWCYVQTCWRRARTDDRGSDSVEHILWYVAAGLGTVTIAALVWTAIRTKAQEPLPTPTAP